MAGPLKRRTTWSKRPVVRSPMAQFKNALIAAQKKRAASGGTLRTTGGRTPGQPTPPPKKKTRWRGRGPFRHR